MVSGSALPSSRRKWQHSIAPRRQTTPLPTRVADPGFFGRIRVFRSDPDFKAPGFQERSVTESGLSLNKSPN